MTSHSDANRPAAAVFHPRARLIRLLGEELISNEIIAVAELVKNAHDADATRCEVRFTAATGPDGCIVIRDDGCGMSRDEFLGGWMQPGGSTKRDRRRRHTPGGRRVLGEKGAGCFATDKLARRLELVSRKRRCPEVHASFCWDDYDDEALLLADVRTAWRERPPEVFPASGTLLRMTGLRTLWNERMFRRLCHRLSRLVSPLRGPDGFQIVIDSDEFPDYAGELRNDFLDRAPYSLRAAFDGGDAVRVTVGGRTWQERWPGPGPLTCGPVQVHLHAFDLETDALARLGPHLEVRAWLREWSGVSVYRDGFRVWPYGEAHDDWLGLDQRRVNNPVVRLSNNQVLGFVEITRDGNPDLFDQTNREGLLHNAAFEDLRRLAHFLLLHLENHRQTIRHPQEAPAESVNDTEPGPLAALEGVAEELEGRARTRARSAIGAVQEFLADLQEKHRRTVASYAELAAAGEAILGVESELRTALATIRDAAADFEEQVRRHEGRVARSLGRTVDLVRSTVEVLDRRLSDLRSVAVQGPRRRTVDLEAEVRRAIRLLEERARRHEIDIAVRAPAAGRLARAEVRPENVCRVLLLLFDNALQALQRQQERRVEVAVWVEGGQAGFDFRDNGPGIPADRAEEVFLPHYTTRPGAAGMGLTIVRAICRANGGDASVLPDSGGRGADVRVAFRRKQSRATRAYPV